MVQYCCKVEGLTVSRHHFWVYFLCFARPDTDFIVNRIKKLVIGCSEHVVQRLSTGNKKANAKLKEVEKSSTSEEEITGNLTGFHFYMHKVEAWKHLVLSTAYFRNANAILSFLKKCQTLISFKNQNFWAGRLTEGTQQVLVLKEFGTLILPRSEELCYFYLMSKHNWIFKAKLGIKIQISKIFLFQINLTKYQPSTIASTESTE